MPPVALSVSCGERTADRRPLQVGPRRELDRDRAIEDRQGPPEIGHAPEGQAGRSSVGDGVAEAGRGAVLDADLRDGQLPEVGKGRSLLQLRGGVRHQAFRARVEHAAVRRDGPRQVHGESGAGVVPVDVGVVGAVGIDPGGEVPDPGLLAAGHLAGGIERDGRRLADDETVVIGVGIAPRRFGDGARDFRGVGSGVRGRREREEGEEGKGGEDDTGDRAVHVHFASFTRMTWSSASPFASRMTSRKFVYSSTGTMRRLTVSR